MGYHLRVGIADEPVASCDQLISQHVVVLDYPVVDYGYLSRAVGVRMGVGGGYQSVSGPSSMADAGRPLYLLKPAFDPQIVDLADVLSDLDTTRDNGQADGVVPPVFETLQSLTDYRRGSLRSSIPKYSTR